MKLYSNRFLFLLFLCFFGFSNISCKDSEEKNDYTCSILLDKEDYTTVANDSNCSNYERGSAELALGGFTLGNILANSSNLSAALGLTASGCDDTAVTTPDPITDETSDSAAQNHFKRAVYWTKDIYIKAGGDATSDKNERGIALMGDFANLMERTYCNIDRGPIAFDGIFSSAEITSFSKTNLDTSTNNSLNASTDIQIYYSNTAYVIKAGNTNFCRQDDNKDGVISVTETTNCNYQTIIDNKSIWELFAPIVRVNSIQKLFDSTADVTKPFRYLSFMTEIIADINSDLDIIGVTKSSPIRDTLERTTNTLNNGATCTSTTNDAISLLDLMIAAGPTTPLTIFNTTATYNLLGDTDVQKFNNALPNVSDATTGLSASTIAKYKLIYSTSDMPTSTDYTAYFFSTENPFVSNASDSSVLTNTKTTLTKLAVLNFDPSTQTAKPDSSTDTEISLKELICASK